MEDSRKQEQAENSEQEIQPPAPAAAAQEHPVEHATADADVASAVEAGQVPDDDEAEQAEFLAAMAQDFEVKVSSRGEMVSGTVVSVGAEYIFVDLGGKGEGMLSLEEFRSEGKMPVVGETIEACVISTGGGIVLSTRLAKGVRDREFLDEAARSKIPVEGRVVSRNKGGFDVEVAGVRGFCPISQIELRFCEDPDKHVGQRYQFLITKYDTSGRRPDMVLTRKQLLQAEAEKAAAELRASLHVGDVVPGRVRNIRDFGAFVDLGGLDGLLPISELSHGRVEQVGDMLQEGEEIHVKVMAIDPDKDRITLSLKQLESDPWDDVMLQFPEGSRTTGRVVRLQPFGAFVELLPGVDGLIHISNMNSPERLSHPKALLNVGDEVLVEILSVDPSARRIGLARVPKDGEFGDIPVTGAIVKGTVDKVAPFGVFVNLGPGRTGLIPNVELGIPKGADARKDFPSGKEVKVLVQEVTEGGRRIRLSFKAALDAEERADFETYMGDDSGQASGKGFGTLGDLLKNKLNQK